MRTSPIDLVRRYHAAINALDFAAIRQCFAPDAVYVSPGTGANSGRDAILEAFERYFAEYADQVASDSLVEQVSSLSARSVWRLAATSRSTGQRIERCGEEVVTFDADGRILRVEVTDR